MRKKNECHSPGKTQYQKLQIITDNNGYSLSNKLFKINCYTKRDQGLAGAAYCRVKLLQLEALFFTVPLNHIQKTCD
jgi:hypothetical protein